MRWVHIDFWFWDCNFRKDAYLNKRKQRLFEALLAKIIILSRPYIKRKFYLYEDIPHCFLALELKDEKYQKKIENIIKSLLKQKPDFLYKMNINLKAGDDASNGEGFLNILDAFTEFYLFKRDNRITHIIHCCIEFMTQSRQDECEFYQNMAILYQVAEVNGRKVAYGFKKITPTLRQRLITYIEKMNLRKRKQWS